MSQNLTVIFAIFMHTAVTVFVKCLNFHPSRLHTISIQCFLRNITSPDSSILIIIQGMNRLPFKQIFF